MSAAPSEWRLVVLGIAQDGGMPHFGCEKGPCAAARAGLRKAERVSCIGVTNGDKVFLFDATPDFPSQVGPPRARLERSPPANVT